MEDLVAVCSYFMSGRLYGWDGKVGGFSFHFKELKRIK